MQPPEVVVDWKDTLFVWRGRLEDANWKGTWVPSATLDVPAEPLFETGFGFSAERTTKGVGRASGDWKGSYAQSDLDGGLQWYPEGPYALREVGDNVVVGMGKNEFGQFVIYGAIDGDVMTLARRYIDFGDERARLGLGELMTWPREDVLDHKKRPVKRRRVAPAAVAGT